MEDIIIYIVVDCFCGDIFGILASYEFLSKSILFGVHHGKSVKLDHPEFSAVEYRLSQMMM